MQFKGKVLLLLNISVEITFPKSNLTSAPSKESQWSTARCSSNRPAPQRGGCSLVPLLPCCFYFKITLLQLSLILGDIWVSCNALLKHGFSLTPLAHPGTFSRVTIPLLRVQIGSPQPAEHGSPVWQSSTALSQTPCLAGGGGGGCHSSGKCLRMEPVLRAHDSNFWCANWCKKFRLHYYLCFSWWDIIHMRQIHRESAIFPHQDCDIYSSSNFSEFCCFTVS